MSIQPTQQASTPTDPSRRQVLCGLAVALLAPGALVAACGGDSGTTSSGSAATTSGAAGGAAGATTGPGGGGGPAALAKLSNIPVGGGVLVDGPSGKLLLVQPTAGTVKAFDARCTHQATVVDAPQGGVISCSAHGSQFNAADGSVKTGPATAPLATVNVRVDGTDVVLA